MENAPPPTSLLEIRIPAYTTGSLPRQVASAWWKVIRLSLPNNFMGANATPTPLPERRTPERAAA